MELLLSGMGCESKGPEILAHCRRLFLRHRLERANPVLSCYRALIAESLRTATVVAYAHACSSCGGIGQKMQHCCLLLTFYQIDVFYGALWPIDGETVSLTILTSIGTKVIDVG